MIIQYCFEPLELKILRCLDTRMTLSGKDKQRLYSLEKGYRGEQKFEEEWLKELPGECFILNDLLLEYNDAIFQIDTLLISQKTIFLLDVKNYEGDFYFEKGIWHRKSGSEIKDPLLQLTRSESLLRRLLQELQFTTFSIEAYLIFINSEFTLYQAPLDLPIIFPTQLNRFMQSLNMGLSRLNEKHSKLAEILVSRQLDDTPYTRLPSYNYDQLQKGITCPSCNTFMLASSIRNKLVCNQCGSIEDIDSAVMRNAVQFQNLFPGRTITTNVIHNWSKVINSKRSIRRILARNFKPSGFGKYSYYIQSK